ncbi:putative disease resistance protein RGA3, partial [Dichanthelium oligosanthes]
MAAVGSCRICRKEKVRAPCCRGVFLRRSCRLRHSTDGEVDVDRISALPEDVLHLFLTRLRCARAAAHTGLLSSRWRTLWTSLPELTFHNTVPDQVEAALARVTRPSLSVLDIHISGHHVLEPAGVTSLLRSATRLAPVELKVDFNGVVRLQCGGNFRQPVEVLLPCFDQTISISMWMSIPVVHFVLPLAGDFLKLESLSLRSCEVHIADLLPRCPSLRKLRIHGSRLLSVITAHSPSLEEIHVSTEEELQRVDIRAPLLKKISIYTDFGISDEFSMSYSSAPKLEELSWKWGRCFSNVGFGIWRLSSLTMEMTKPLGGSQLANDEESTCLQQQHCPRVDAVGVEECYADCSCDEPNNWRSQTVPMTDLKEVEIKGFKGEAQEIDLLKLIFRSTTILERVTIDLYHKECNPSSVFKFCRDVGTDYIIANDIHELNQKLDGIYQEGERLHLKPVLEDQIRLYQIRLNLDVSPDLEPDIVGREVESDCDSLIELLKREDIPSRPNHPLFAIIGTIGVGKTTLARKVYHKAETMFETRVWVHVSKDLRHMSMWSGEGFSKGETAGQQALLRTWLQGYKFLLVIDDVWGENVWDGLLEIQAQHGSHGSRILITTRNEHVARRMGAVHLHHVKGLNEDDGWWLLRTRAFLDESTGNMQDIGRRIVQKCNGLPMAIRRIGCILREVDQKEDDWRRIYSSDFCGLSSRIRNAINMSYLELPYYLKRCFVYCSLYPEGSVIDRQRITQQWIAEGFIVTQQNTAHSTTVEEEAEKCYDKLLAMGLLLPESGAYGAERSKMPHLFRSFALLQSLDEYFIGNPQDIGDVLKPCRLSITTGGAEALRNGIRKLKCLRPIILSGSPLNDRALGDIFQKFMHLRVLDLGGTQIECVARSLGSMTHLRYLSFANTQIREIPSTIENLRMLQFLILKNCTSLNTLTESLGRLTNLRTLDISGAGLNQVKFGFSMMKELNCLQGFL